MSEQSTGSIYPPIRCDIPGGSASLFTLSPATSKLIRESIIHPHLRTHSIDPHHSFIALPPHPSPSKQLYSLVRERSTLAYPLFSTVVVTITSATSKHSHVASIFCAVTV